MKQIDSIGIQVPEVYLPRPKVDLFRWAVIAVDQFTSQPEYWENVEKLVGDAPSTYHLILPEVFLGTQEEQYRIETIQAKMVKYLENETIIPQQGFVYVERTVSGKTRKGLMLCLDLEKYDYSKGSQSLIRATEGTIVERLPPRIKIREGAPLEVPHILVLIDDPQHTVIAPLREQKERLTRLYETELMFGSGVVEGYLVDDDDVEKNVIHSLESLARPLAFQEKYGVGGDQQVLLFAMGDGNHSLATAKAIWEKMKAQVGMDHPARYALVEVENVHDEALSFEPIHRVLFGVRGDLITTMRNFYEHPVDYTPSANLEDMIAKVDNQTGGDVHQVGWVCGGDCGVISISKPKSNLPVGTLQSFLDAFIKEGGADKIDYVHGEQVIADLGCQDGNMGFYLPAMDKSDLFKTVILDGALPRKTFSMGEAHEKRFYMECRKIA